MLRLASILKEIAGDVERFVDKPTESSKSEISDNISTVTQLRAQLLALSVPDIQAVLATQKTDLAQLRQAFTDYLSAVAVETTASKQLNITAGKLNTSVAELF